MIQKKSYNRREIKSKGVNFGEVVNGGAFFHDGYMYQKMPVALINGAERNSVRLLSGSEFPFEHFDDFQTVYVPLNLVMDVRVDFAEQ